MELEGSSPHLQQPTTCPYPEPDRYILCPPPPSNLSKIQFNIILQSTPGSFKKRKQTRWIYFGLRTLHL
jgi:hypothetical protein